MSDHFDAEDGRTDLTDIYAFPADAGGRTVLVMCFNPDPAETEPMFDPGASYELKLDTDGDALADVAFHVSFSAAEGSGTATVRRATGEVARGWGAVGEVIIERAPISTEERVRITETGPYRFFAGVRSDPHFKDILGFRNNFQFTGHDPVASRNVFGVALEVPNEAIGAGKPLRIWARTMASVDGAIVQVDQAGRPGVNNAFNLDEEDNAEFCGSEPAGQLAAFGARFTTFLLGLGYSQTEAASLLPSYLPDWLPYDPGLPTGYPNGRRLTDDTADLLAALLTRGQITSDTVGPHTDLLAEFPHLGPPHAEAGPTV